MTDPRFLVSPGMILGFKSSANLRVTYAVTSFNGKIRIDVSVAIHETDADHILVRLQLELSSAQQESHRAHAFPFARTRLHASAIARAAYHRDL